LKGNLHDQFLEGWAGVIPPGYSATGGERVVVTKYPPNQLLFGNSSMQS